MRAQRQTSCGAGAPPSDGENERPRPSGVYVKLVPQALLLARAPHALRWRLETFGLYMPSLPEARPWWRPSARALRALCRQLPGYARWLAEMQALRHGGACGWWRYRTGTDARDWEEWLALARQETDE
jgi:hypothetical protein